MTNEKSGSSKGTEKPVADLEGISDEDLEDVQGGTCVIKGTCDTKACTSNACGCGGGGGCGICKTEPLPVMGREGDVEMNPMKKRPLGKYPGGTTGPIIQKK